MTTSSALAASVAAAFGAALLVAPRPWRPPRATTVRVTTERAMLLRLRPLLVPLACLGAWAFLGGFLGVVAGLVTAALAWNVLGRTESPAARRRREELERDLPVAVQLIGACLEAGAAISGALDAVAAALPGAVSEELLLARHRLSLGMDPMVVWRELAGHPQLRPLGRAMARAHQSGASVRDTIAGLADELTAQSRATTEALARSVEVRAAAPLGVCFLPAFLALGVVPMVAGVFSAMRLFG